MTPAGRRFLWSSLAVLSAPIAPAGAQPVVPPVSIIDFAGDAQMRALAAQAKASIKPGQAMAPSLPVVRVPGYRAVLEYRAAPTPPQSHDRDAEFMYVVDGSGTIILGGTLVEPHRPNEANVMGTSIAGGTPHPLTPGSFIFVPKAVPHHFAEVGPNGLTVVTMHIPVAAP